MSDSVMDKWNKRKCFPVDLGDGISGRVRKLSFRQIRDSGTLNGDDKTAFIMGCCICNDDGTPIIQRGADESLADFVKRSADTHGDIDPDNLTAAMNAIVKITTPPPVDTVVKN